MIFVTITTMTAGVQLVGSQWPPLYRQGRGLQATLNIGLTIFVIASVGSLMILAISRWNRGADRIAAHQATTRAGPAVAKSIGVISSINAFASQRAVKARNCFTFQRTLLY